MEPTKVVPILLASPVEDVAKVLLELKPEDVAPIWTAIIDASNKTEANARSVSNLIELMGRIHTGIGPATQTNGVPVSRRNAPAATPSPVLNAATESLFQNENPDEPKPFTPAEIELHQRIAKTYLNMDPVKVAPILLATSPRDAAGVLLQMRPEAIAVIWSAIIDDSRRQKGTGATEKVVAMAEYMRRNRNGV